MCISENTTIKKRYKARQVTLGYGWAICPILAHLWSKVIHTVRLFLALATMHPMHVHQLEVASALCHADIDGEVFMEPPHQTSIYAQGVVLQIEQVPVRIADFIASVVESR